MAKASGPGNPCLISALLSFSIWKGDPRSTSEMSATGQLQYFKPKLCTVHRNYMYWADAASLSLPKNYKTLFLPISHKGSTIFETHYWCISIFSYNKGMKSQGNDVTNFILLAP